MILDAATITAIAGLLTTIGVIVGAITQAIVSAYVARKKYILDEIKLPVDLTTANVSAAASLTNQMSTLLQQSLIDTKTLRDDLIKVQVSNSRKDLALLRIQSLIQALLEDHAKHDAEESFECPYFVNVVVHRLRDILSLAASNINGSSKSS